MHSGLQWIDDAEAELSALSKTVWEFAETGLKEIKSANVEAAFLKQEGFDIQMGVAGMPSAFVASWGSGQPAIGFLGEYDALPGLSQTVSTRREAVVPGAPGHGCGHNLLGVGALAAAIALKREMEAEGKSGTVRFYGCPAEETLSGKVYMAKHGLYDDLGAAITWHPMTLNTAWGSTCLAIDSARFIFHGRAAHAAASPEMGISALDAVELMNVGVNYLREHVVQEARMHYVITKGGGEPNVVPELAEVWYYIRAPRRQDVEKLYQRVVKIAEGACLMTGATLEIKFEAGSHEYLPNAVVSQALEDGLMEVGAPRFTAEELAFAKELEQSFEPGQKEAVMRGAGIPSKLWDITLHQEIEPMYDRGRLLSGSTDVGDVSWIVPTGQITTATYVAGTTSHSWQATVTAGMSIGQKSMITAAKAMALAGWKLVSQPELLQQAKDAFVKDTGGQPYVSPLPDGVVGPPLPEEH